MRGNWGRRPQETIDRAKTLLHAFLAQTAYNQPTPPCCAPVRLSMNVLTLDPGPVRVETSEVCKAAQMDRLDMEVVKRRDSRALGDGLHCCTADVFREGGSEDSFRTR